jgi:hypothetical protein
LLGRRPKKIQKEENNEMMDPEDNSVLRDIAIRLGTISDTLETIVKKLDYIAAVSDNLSDICEKLDTLDITATIDAN